MHREPKWCENLKRVTNLPSERQTERERGGEVSKGVCECTGVCAGNFILIPKITSLTNRLLSHTPTRANQHLGYNSTRISFVGCTLTLAPLPPYVRSFSTKRYSFSSIYLPHLRLYNIAGTLSCFRWIYRYFVWLEKNSFIKNCVKMIIFIETKLFF